MATKADEHPFSSSDGALLVGAARKAIFIFLQSRKIAIPQELFNDSRFDRKLGCFVTLKHVADDSLRGCIGFPEPSHRLSHALSMAAIYAATEDPRFPPVTMIELENLIFEVSLLTAPERVVSSPSDRASMVKVGVDGLILKWPFGSGLLLPQVATEQNWNATEFLQNLSLKAGADQDQWKSTESVLYKFGALVFQETNPNGPVLLSK